MLLTPRLILYYVREVTDVWAANEPRPPEDPHDYAGLMLKTLDRASSREESAPLLAAIRHVLDHPEIDAGPLVSEVFPYSDEKARELLKVVLELAPTAPPADPVEWSDLPVEAWRRAR